MEEGKTRKRSLPEEMRKGTFSSVNPNENLSRETPKRNLPLHFSLGMRELEREALLSVAKWINEERISALWVDVHTTLDIKVVKTLTSTFDCPIIAGIADPSLIGAALKKGCRGIALSPDTGKNADSFLKEILKHRKAFESEERRVYLLVLQAAEPKGELTALSPPRAPAEFNKHFLARIHTTLSILKKVQAEGIKSVFLNIEHENPVFLYNLCRRLKEQSGTRHVFTFCCGNGSEEDLINHSLSLGPLYYNGIGEALLIKLKPVLPFNIERIRKAVHGARLILRSLDLAPMGLRIISCPTCGRCSIDLTSVAHQVEHELRELEKRLRNEGKRTEDSGGITVAVMGCSVNGPGEARSADIGIAGRKDRTGVLFKLGYPIQTIPEERLVEELMKHTEALLRKRIEVQSLHT